MPTETERLDPTAPLPSADDRVYEVVDGEKVERGPMGLKGSSVAGELSELLFEYKSRTGRFLLCGGAAGAFVYWLRVAGYALSVRIGVGTTSYLLVRRAVDGTDVTEIYTPESEKAFEFSADFEEEPEPAAARC